MSLQDWMLAGTQGKMLSLIFQFPTS